ncbi:MAG: SDR family oxidoreductase [Candidatus Hydrogenedentes bacterium]|nr:SDR family oxidoreductase [Candidatus Hydrogenedentota bacterium]
MILVTGATGYVGGRLVTRLEARGFQIRCMARTPERLRDRLPRSAKIVRGDVTEPTTLDEALCGIDTAFYLVHALASRGDFESTELAGARNFAAAAERAGVNRIIYLGGLGDTESPSSAHMRSRHAVGQILRESGVPTLEFQASIIIGPGSLSFELIRSLVQRLPVMLVPRWVRVKAQPIAIDDVLEYLVQAIDLPMSKSTVYEIGGEEQLSYLDLMKRYGEIAGLRRLYINVPFLTPWLSSLWLNLVTPLFAKVGRKLIDSIRIASVVADDKALRDFTVRPMNVSEAIRRAQREEDQTFRETHWSDALSSSTDKSTYGGKSYGSRIVDSRTIAVDALPERVFECIERIGGPNGWYYGDWLWRIRGVLDRMVGGVGMQRGRRDPIHLRMGDIVDCWRVEAIERPYKLLLRAEMKVFGRAWLQFEVNCTDSGTEIRQTAIYDPRGLVGNVYWYALYPLHELVFRGMLRGIAEAALGNDASQPCGRVKKVEANHNSMPPLS